MTRSLGQSVRELPARAVMHQGVLNVYADMTVAELAAFLLEHQISGAPVLDRRGQLVGTVSLHDIAEERGRVRPDGPARRPEWRNKLNPEDLATLHFSGDRLVADIMTPTTYTVPEELPVKELARTMVAGRIHRLFVSREGAIVGVVSASDLLRLIAEEGTSPSQPAAPAA